MHLLPEKIPDAARLLGYAGIVPFFALALAAYFVPAAYELRVFMALKVYAALIITFVGALHWGIAMFQPQLSDSQAWQLYGWGVVPALMAWVLVFQSASYALAGFVTLFIVQWLMDRAAARTSTVPPWFQPLRARLTLLVVVALLVALPRALSLT